jgi:Trk K+ transport system NAD-binding subunit
MLERDVIVTIPVDRHVLLVAEVRVHAGSPLVGQPLRRADRALSTRVVGLTEPGSQWLSWTPDLEHRLVPGDKILVVARRAGLRALADLAAPPVLQRRDLDA